MNSSASTSSKFLSSSPTATTVQVSRVPPPSSITITSTTPSSTIIIIIVIFVVTLLIGVIAIMLAISTFHRRKSGIHEKNNPESASNYDDLIEVDSAHLNIYNNRSIPTQGVSINIIGENRKGFLPTPTTKELEEENIITPKREHFMIPQSEFPPEGSGRPVGGRGGRVQRGRVAPNLDFGGIGGEMSNKKKRRESEGGARWMRANNDEDEDRHKRYSL